MLFCSLYKTVLLFGLFILLLLLLLCSWTLACNFLQHLSCYPEYWQWTDVFLYSGYTCLDLEDFQSVFSQSWQELFVVWVSQLPSFVKYDTIRLDSIREIWSRLIHESSSLLYLCTVVSIRISFSAWFWFSQLGVHFLVNMWKCLDRFLFLIFYLKTAKLLVYEIFFDGYLTCKKS